MTERIDHAAKAIGLSANADHESDTAWAQVWVQMGQIHATLALVEQQRIANLIAAAQMEGGPYREINKWTGAWLKVTDEIKEALGL